MRFSAFTTIAAALGAAGLGCAQVTGIEDISTAVPQRCVDTLTMLRAGEMLGPLVLWGDNQQCADEAAADGNHAGCGTFNYFGCGSGESDPDTAIQSCVNTAWASDHDLLADPENKKAACGFGVGGGFSNVVLLFSH
jgi:hypothetical protein